MLRVIDFRTREITPFLLNEELPRARQEVSDVASTVKQLIAEVRADGVEALQNQAERFDGVRPHHVQVSLDEIKRAEAALPESIRRSMLTAIERVRQASRAQVPADTHTEFAKGARVSQRWRPVSRVGLYVPGGKAVYPSSVIMNVVPAQVAGVETVYLASPAQKDFAGSVHPFILGAAGLLGVTRVFAMGGAGAIGAFAHGVPELDLTPVDVITGPGNLFVAAAKREVSAVCGIDAEAGPTEIMVLADETANPELIAADLLSQAEHDEQAGSVLVTTAETLAAEVQSALETRLSQTANRERASAALAGSQSAVILVDSLDDAITVANGYAAEHLEIMTANSAEVAERINNAGAIFLGNYAPVSLGDYSAGSNHVLPTGGQARFSSALGSYSFLRAQQVIDYDEQALAQISTQIVDFAQAEQLPAHGEAIQARFEAPGAHSAKAKER